MGDLDIQGKNEMNQTNGQERQPTGPARLEAFLKQLRSGLSKVPKATADDAILYYEEYVAEARQSGVPDDEILNRLGPPEQVLRAILDDLSITSTQSRPSAARLIRTSQRVMGKGVARAAAGTSLAIVSVVPLSAAIVLYAVAFALSLAALTVIAGAVINIATHPELGTTDLLGQGGLAVALASALLLAALVIRLGANGLARSTLNLYRKITPGPRKPSSAEVPAPKPVKRRRGAQILSFLMLVCLSVGLILSLIAGLPQQYFRLWNSVPPAKVEPVQMTLTGTADSINKMEISGLNANIRLVPSTDGQLKVAYDQAPYARLDWSQKGNVLQLAESGNGLLPGFEWLAVHEGTASMTIALPGLTHGIELDIETKGGDVTIRLPNVSGRVRTINGDITLYTDDEADRISLFSRNGGIVYLKD